ncbi:MAG: hypothetical protein GWO24_37340, partial [Akkermansiaceae bacterium]|nr:hypothetical protein [Akkermansiaceae bacterium]
ELVVEQRLVPENKERPANNQAWVAAFSPGFERVALSQGYAAMVYVADTDNGEVLWEWETGEDVRALAFSRDGARLAIGSGGNDQTTGRQLKLMNLETGRQELAP